MAHAPSNESTARRSPLPWPWWVAGGLLAALLVVFPPFRVVSRQTPAAPGAASTSGPAAFEPVAFAARFWTEKLQPAALTAPEAAPVLAALRRDPTQAAKTYAHRVGLGHSAFYFARSQGRIVGTERGRLLVEIDGAVVAVRTGLVFGNVVRDGCGLLEVNQVPGLAEFNALSAELNRLVETRVQPPLKTAAVGATLVFSGCAEAPETVPASGPLLTFIPVRVEVKP